MNQERDDYADPEPSGLDELADGQLVGSTLLWVVAMIGTTAAFWVVAVLVDKGLLR